MDSIFPEEILTKILSYCDCWTVAYGFSMASKQLRRLAMADRRRVELRIIYKNVLRHPDGHVATVQYCQIPNKWNYVKNRNESMGANRLCLRDTARRNVLKDISADQLWVELARMPWFFRIASSKMDFCGNSAHPVSLRRVHFISETMRQFDLKFKIGHLELRNAQITTPELYQHFEAVVNIFPTKLLVNLMGRFDTQIENVVRLLLQRGHNVEKIEIGVLNKDEYGQLMSFIRENCSTILRGGLSWRCIIRVAFNESPFHAVVETAEAMAKADQFDPCFIRVTPPSPLNRPNWSSDPAFRSPTCSGVSLVTSIERGEVVARTTQEFPEMRVYVQDEMFLSNNLEFEITIKAKCSAYFAWTSRYSGSDERFMRPFLLNEDDEITFRDRVDQRSFDAKYEPHLSFTYVEYSPAIKPVWLTLPRFQLSKEVNIFPPEKSPFDVRYGMQSSKQGSGAIFNPFQKRRPPFQ